VTSIRKRVVLPCN